MSDQVQVALISFLMVVTSMVTFLLAVRMAHKQDLRKMEMEEPIGVIEEIVHDDQGVSFRGHLFSSARGTQVMSYIYGAPPKKKAKDDG